MSEDIATLGIKVDSSDVSGATGELRILIDVSHQTEQSAKKVENAFGGLKTALAGLGLGELVRKYIDLSDTFANIEGRLSLVTSGTAQLSDVTDKLYESANRSRVSFEATADLYSSLARSTKTLGTSQTDLLRVTETINKALIVSGASAATAEGALTQLGQGFASGTLRGDELNSVLEGTPRLAQAIADGMKVTVGQLRGLGAQGKITGETVFNALKSQSDAVDKEFAKMPVTVSQAFTVLSNSVLKFVGEANQGNGATATLAAGIQSIAANLPTVALAFETLAVAVGIKTVGAFVAAQAATLAEEAALVGLSTTAEIVGFGIGKLLVALAGLSVVGGVAIAVVALANSFMQAKAANEAANKAYQDSSKELKTMQDIANGSSTATTGAGNAARAAGPGFDYLTGKARTLAKALYDQADAAKQSRVQTLLAGLAKSQEAEKGLQSQSAAGRAKTDKGAWSALMRGDLLTAFDPSSAAGGTLNLLSGGRRDADNAKAIQQQHQATLNYQKEVDLALHGTSDGVAKQANANQAAIDKLNASIAGYRKLRTSVSGDERLKIDARIKADTRKVGLLTAGQDESAVNDIVGNGGSGKAPKPKKDPGERKFDQETKQAEDYITNLNRETDSIGKAQGEQKMLSAVVAANKAPTKELAAGILEAANNYDKASIAAAANAGALKVITDYTKQHTEAQDKQLQTASEMADKIQLENNMFGLSITQREVAKAKLDLETKGIKEGTLAYETYADSILGAAEAKGKLLQQADDAGKFADHMDRINTSVKDATASFSELFGTAGQGFASLINLASDNADAQARSQKKIADAMATNDPAQIANARAEAAEEASQRELNSYGTVIHGVKSMFNEKSKAYKVMEGVEKAYSVIRLAMAVREILTEGLITTAKVGGAGARMAADGVETGSSVAKSAIRATAHGIEAFAHTLASLPFPLNIAAGAAVLAALVGVGVAIAGGGGGSKASASATTEDAKPTNYANNSSSYSVEQQQPGYGAVNTSGSGVARIVANDSSGAAAAKGGDTHFNYQIDARGSDNPDAVVSRVQDMLVAHQDDTIQKARLAVQKDQVKAANRQNIGGSR